MYFQRKYLIKAKLCRNLLKKTKFFLGERVNYKHCKHDFWDSDHVKSTNKDLYFASYSRYKEIELLANEINEHNIEGSVAELGVYKGTTSAAINILFPDKKLFLFDTFEGFSEEQNKEDIEAGLTNGMYDLTDTSEDIVLGQMARPENCIVRKGLFPTTAEGLEETFCFVSLDTDLYQPILDGLKYFYPRLTRGGYIIVHDYNNGDFRGIKKAVLEYEKGIESKLILVPITDLCGSVVICK